MVILRESRRLLPLPFVVVVVFLVDQPSFGEMQRAIVGATLAAGLATDDTKPIGFILKLFFSLSR